MPAHELRLFKRVGILGGTGVQQKSPDTGKASGPGLERDYSAAGAFFLAFLTSLAGASAFLAAFLAALDSSLAGAASSLAGAAQVQASVQHSAQVQASPQQAGLHGALSQALGQQQPERAAARTAAERTITSFFMGVPFLMVCFRGGRLGDGAGIGKREVGHSGRQGKKMAKRMVAERTSRRVSQAPGWGRSLAFAARM